MATLDSIRAARPWAADMSDAELLQVISDHAKAPIQSVADAFGIKTGQDMGVLHSGVSSGTDGLQGLGYSAIAAGADAVGFDRGKEWALRNARANQSEAALNGRPELERVEDQTWGTALPFVGYQVAKQSPQIAGAFALGAVAPEAAVPAWLARGAATMPLKLGGGGLQAGASFAARKAALGAGNTFARNLVGGAGIGAAMGAGSMYQESVDAGDPSPYASLGLAPIYGLTEGLPTALLGGTLLRGGGFTGNLITRMGKSAAVNAGTGAASELTQNEMEMGFNPNLSAEEKFSRRLNSGVVGGLAEGSFGALGGVHRPYQPQDLLNPQATQNPLQPPATGLLPYDPSVGPALNGQINPNAYTTFPDGSVATSQDTALMKANGILPEQLDALRQGGVRVDPAMDTGDQAPYLPNVMIADAHGAAAVDAPGAQALYGEDNGDPGLTEARRRYEAQRAQSAEAQAAAEKQAAEIKAQQKAEFDAKVAAADKAREENKSAAYEDIFTANERTPAGAYPVVLQPKVVEQLAVLRGMRPAIGDESFFKHLSDIREGVQTSQPAAMLKAAKTAVKDAQKLLDEKAKQAEKEKSNVAQTAKTQQAKAQEPQAATTVAPNGTPSTPPAGVTGSSAPASVVQSGSVGPVRPDVAVADASAVPASAVDAPVSETTPNAAPPVAPQPPVVKTKKARLVPKGTMPGASPVAVASTAEPSGIADAPVDPIKAAADAVREKRRKRAANAEALAKGAAIPHPDVATNMNSGGVSSEDLQDMLVLAIEFVRDGVRSFGAYSKAMVAEFGDSVKPYLRRLYTQADAELKTKREDLAVDEHAPDKPPMVSFSSNAKGEDISLVAKYGGKSKTKHAVANFTNGQWVLDPSKSGLEGASPIVLGETREDALYELPYAIAASKGEIEAAKKAQREADKTAGVKPTTRENARAVHFQTQDTGVDATGAIDPDKVDAAVGHSLAHLRAVRYVLGIEDDGTRMEPMGYNAAAQLAHDRTQSEYDLEESGAKAPLGKSSEAAISRLIKTQLGITPEALDRFRLSSIQAKPLDGHESYALEVSEDDTADPFTADRRDVATQDGVQLSDEDTGDVEVHHSAAEQQGLRNTSSMKGTIGETLDIRNLRVDAVRRGVRNKHLKQVMKDGIDKVDTFNLILAADEMMGFVSTADLTGRESKVARDNAAFNTAVHTAIAEELNSRAEDGRLRNADMAAARRELQKSGQMETLRDKQRTVIDDAPEQNLSDRLSKGELLDEHDSGLSGENTDNGQSEDTAQGKSSYDDAVDDGREEETLGEDDAQYSKAKPTEGSNAAEVVDEVAKLMRVGALNSKIMVVQSVADLPAGIQRSVNLTADTQGFVVNGKAYLVASNIAKGKACSVFLHEVGAHLGLENLLGKAQYAALVGQIKKWAGRADGSQESMIAKAAQQRVVDAGTDGTQTDSELLAYFIEEAVDAGVDPTATKAATEFGRWFRTLWAAFKRAMHKLGVNPDKLTAQDIVDMAYGAAKLETTGTFHGTAADFRKFDHRVQFSKAAASALSKQRQSAVEKIRSSMSPQAKDSWATVRDWIKSKQPWLLTNAQLVEQFGDKLKSLKDYSDLQHLMSSETNTQTQVFHNIAVQWDKLRNGNKAMHERLSNLMLRATLEEVHPDIALTHEDNKHLTPDTHATYDKLSAEYKALSPDAKRVYQDAKKALKDAWQARRDAYERLVGYTFAQRMAESEGDTAKMDQISRDEQDALKAYDLNEVKGPYFPLVRFGSYLAIAESPKFKALKAQVEAATGKERRTLDAQLQKLKKDRMHYRVSAHETLGQRNAAVRQMKADGFEDPRTDMTDQYLDGMRAVSQDTLSHITDMINSQFDPNVAADLNRSMSSIFLRSLPEMHALHREAARRGIEGASTDMLRAFATTGQQGAFYTARLMYASELSDSLQTMKKEAKVGGPDLQHIHREMEKRMALDMRRTETPVQNAIGTLSWISHLGLSPSFIVINSTQPWLVTGPVLAGKFGFGRATKALTSASQDALKVLHAARFKDNKWDAWSGISEDSLSSKEERTMIRELMKRGIVDEGAQNDLTQFANGKTNWLDRVSRVSGWATQQVELVNRMATALASFRLARQKMSYEDAMNYAYDTTVATQFDYSAEGTARVMREGGGVPFARLIFQFRRYQQGMMYLLGSNLKKAFTSPTERKQAAATLGYFVMSSGMAAGALGLPFIGTATALANLMIDDDDPEGDAETRLRNIIYHMTGDDKALSDILTKGVPAAFGADFSKRIGLSDVAQPFPMMRFSGARTGRAKAGETLLNVIGPSGGMLASAFDAYDLFDQGDWYRGTEKLVPKAIMDPLRASRYATQGMTDGSGDPTGTAISGWDVTLKTLGIAPISEANYYEGTAAIKDVTTATSSRKGNIGNKYRAALRDGDMSSVRQMITKFNQDHPENKITPRTENEWRKAAHTAMKNRGASSGIKYGTKTTEPYNKLAAFSMSRDERGLPPRY